jgi:hypothetical protein
MQDEGRAAGLSPCHALLLQAQAEAAAAGAGGTKVMGFVSAGIYQQGKPSATAAAAVPGARLPARQL